MADIPALEALVAIYPGIPQAALEVYLANYGLEGGTSAWAIVRQDARYETWFPGNLTDEGDVRYDETRYAGIKDAYDAVYGDYGIDPKWLEGHYGDLIRGEKSPTEFRADVSLVYDRIVSSSDAVKEWYATQAGINGITTEALLLAHLDPELESGILEGNISMAEVGGTFADFGYDLDIDLVDQLVDRDMTKAGATELGGQANQLIPIMEMLAKRHHDPDDDFDITEFLQSEFFKDPGENYRMRRLMSQERAMFGNIGSIRRNQQGSLTGLVAE